MVCADTVRDGVGCGVGGDDVVTPTRQKRAAKSFTLGIRASQGKRQFASPFYAMR